MQQTYDLSRVIVLSPEHQRKSIQFPRDTPVLVHSSDPLSAPVKNLFSRSLNKNFTGTGQTQRELIPHDYVYLCMVIYDRKPNLIYVL